MRRSRLLVYVLLSLAFILGTANLPTARAQDDTDDTGARIQYGQVVSGQINGLTPRTTYTLDALRCDFVSVRVTATSGDLDPILTILTPDGSPLLTRDDADGSRNAAYEPLKMPRSGSYRLVVGRFGYDLGTTAGGYELLVERVGNGSDPNCAMRYGDTVFYTITDTQPEVVYSFRAEEGDIINVEMERRSGDLDPYVQIVDDQGYVLEFNDDVFGAETKDAAIRRFLIPRTATYFIFATRYGMTAGTSTGNFSLHLEESQNSGIGNSPLAAIPFSTGEQVEGELDDSRHARYYRFEAQQNDIVSVSMTRLTGDLDTLVVLANASLQELVVNDDRNDQTQNSRISDYLIPASGTYYLIATRYEREAGDTAGRYRLELNDEGSAFGDVPDDVRRIRYGTSITGNIDSDTPSVRYAFWGEAGDEVRITMNRSTGDLDPYVSILTASGRQLFSDDDGGANKNARIDRYRLPNTGVYYVEASRYQGADNPGTGGSYVLVLAQLADQR